MKKQILNLGKALNKVEQKQINGGLRIGQCYNDSDCCNFEHNSSYGYICTSNGDNRGRCVPGIFSENPCGL